MHLNLICREQEGPRVNQGIKWLKRNPARGVEGVREGRRGSEGTGKREWRGNFDWGVRTNKQK